MNKKSLKNLAMALIFVAFIVVIGLGLINAGIITTEAPELKDDQIQVTLIIDYGDNNIDRYEVETTSTTVYLLLMDVAEEHNFDVLSTYYEQFDSHFIESINSVGGEGDVYWLYYINGEPGIISADAQIVEDSDIVEWKYEKSEY
jgi:hypothetical protein